jgi:hypothetical protein
MLKPKRVMIDPPNGWRYGFPKMLPLIPKEGKNFKLKKWLIDEGYPPHEIADAGINFQCRMWETD